MFSHVKLSNKRLFKAFILAVLSGISFYTGYAFGAPTIDSVVSNVTTAGASLARLITGVAYLAGLGFAMGSILKFKQHKDNPTQIPIGTPIALLLIAAALMFLPSVFRLAGNTVFGVSAQSGDFSGVNVIS
ncbi:MAG: hypothetical protein LEGION0398_MBIBDBAK_00466 [Legionellaceae bacterium]